MERGWWWWWRNGEREYEKEGGPRGGAKDE
jgi:hypothetical protein